jgi:hypothetical protein
MLVPETVDPADVKPIDADAIAEAAAQVFGPPDEAEKPAETAEERDEKGRFLPKKGEETRAEPEKPDEEKPKPEDDKVAARINAAKRTELRAAQERAELQRTRAELDRQKAELAELAKVADAVKAAKLSPSKLMELAGLQPKDFLETLAREHEPETVAQRVALELRGELEATRKEIAALKEERERERMATERQRVETTVAEAQKAFLDHVSSQVEAYPHLVEEFTPEEIAAQALALAEEHGQDYFARFGVYPDDDVIAEELDRQAKKRAERRSQWRQRLGKAASESGKGDSSGEASKRPAVKAEGPRTLTSRSAAQKATPPRNWSQEDADAESLRILESALAGKR